MTKEEVCKTEKRARGDRGHCWCSQPQDGEGTLGTQRPGGLHRLGCTFQVKLQPY